MAEAFQPRFVDLVRNYTMTQGTGNFLLGNAVTGFTGFAAAIQPGETFYYSAIGLEKPAEREVGRGTMQPDGSIARDPIDGELTDFSPGHKTVALIAAAEWFNRVETMSANAGGSSTSAAVESRTELAALPDTTVTAMLGEAGREGLFRHDPSDCSTAAGADPAQGVHVPVAADPSGTSGAWVRTGSRLTPHMFGAVPGTGADRTANTAALQAFFDFALDQDHARRFVFDWSGEWPVNGTLYAAYPAPNGAAVEEVVRTFIAGKLVYPPTSGMPGGTVIENGLVIGGYFQRWIGKIAIRVDGWTNYASKSVRYGVRLIAANSSNIDAIDVVGVRRSAVLFDPASGVVSLRPGTPGAVTYSYSNNIGVQVGDINGRYFGSSMMSPALALTLAYSAIENGGLGAGQAFDATAATYNGSFVQRSRVTVADSSEFVAGGVDFVSIDGRIYQVREIEDSTHICVFPWVHPSAPQNGTLTAVTGFAADIQGANTAHVKIGAVTGFSSGGAVRAGGLYGPRIGKVLAEFSQFGVVHGIASDGVNLGVDIGGSHFEAVGHVLLQTTGSAASAITISGANSSIDRTKLARLRPRLFQTDAETLDPTKLVSADVNYGAERVMHGTLEVDALLVGGGAVNGIADGDKGDIVVSGGGATWQVQGAAGDFAAGGAVSGAAFHSNGTSFSDWNNSTALHVRFRNAGAVYGYLGANANGVLILDPSGMSRLTVSAAGIDVGGTIRVNGTQVLGARQAAIADSAGGDEKARINAILVALRTHGLIAP